MWRSVAVMLVCASMCGYSSGGPVGTKRNMEIHEKHQPMITEPDASHESDQPKPEVVDEMTISMMPPTLTLPSNATSIRSDITDVFKCEDRPYGYYADVENDCQIFHVCLPVTYADGKENIFRWSFICPEETMFSQDSFTCMRPEDMSIDCQDSYKYYDLNRNFGVVEEETDNHKDTGVATTHSGHHTSTVPVEDAEPSDSNAVQHSVLPAPSTPAKETSVQGEPLKETKPIRRKPVHSTSNYPVRKHPQSYKPTSTLGAEPAPVVEVIEEEAPKPMLNKYIRRPVKTPTFVENKKEEHKETHAGETNENQQATQTETIKEPQKQEQLATMQEAVTGTQNEHIKEPERADTREPIMMPSKFDKTRVRPTSNFHKRKQPQTTHKVIVAEEPIKEIIPVEVKAPEKTVFANKEEEITVPQTVTNAAVMESTAPSVQTQSDKGIPLNVAAIQKLVEDLSSVVNVPTPQETPLKEDIPQELEKLQEPIEAFPEIPAIIEDVVEAKPPSIVADEKDVEFEFSSTLPVNMNPDEKPSSSTTENQDHLPTIETEAESFKEMEKKDHVPTNIAASVSTQSKTEEASENIRGLETVPEKINKEESVEKVYFASPTEVSEHTKVEGKPEEIVLEETAPEVNIPMVADSADTPAPALGEQESIVSEMSGDDVEHLKQSMGGFKPVDPAKAAEAEALIADFLNTLMTAEAANAKPINPADLHTQETNAEVGFHSTEEHAVKTENEIVPGDDALFQESGANFVQDTAMQSDHTTAQWEEDAKADLPFGQGQKMTNAINFPVMNSFPSDMYHIPVQVIQAPLEEMHRSEMPAEQTHPTQTEHVADASANRVENDATADEPAPVTVNHHNPLSIDAIVSMVKERLDQMPPEEKDTPIQLVMQPLEQISSSLEGTNEVATESHKPSVETIIMPIYHRTGTSPQAEATQTAESSTADRDSSDKTNDPEALVGSGKQVDKSGRLFRSRSIKNAAKMDPRKRRFLFRKDAS